MASRSDMHLEIFDAIPEPVILLDTADRVKSLNRNAARLLDELFCCDTDGTAACHALHAWLNEELTAFSSGGRGELSFSKQLETPAGKRFFEVSLNRPPARTVIGAATVIYIRELTEWRNVENVIHEMVLGVSAKVGDEFFRSLLQHLTRALDVDYAFVCEYAGPERASVKTVAFCADGEPGENFEFELAGTPCANVVSTGYYCCSDKLLELFPMDHIALRMEVQSYAGIALTDSAGNVIGPMAVFSRSPLRDEDLAEAMLKVFAMRASAEVERKRAEEARQEQLHFLQALLDSIPHPVFFKDAQGRYLGCNKALEDFLGVAKDVIVGRTVHEIAPPERARTCHAIDVELLRKGGTQTYDSTVTASDGGTRHIIFNKATFNNSDGAIGGLVGTIMDITDRKLAEEAVQQLAYYDTLTGLPNRTLLKERLGEVLAQAGRDGCKVAVLFIDLDRFKGVNETLGHASGDKLLTVIAERLKSHARAAEMVARLGGDEFVLMVTAISDEEDVVAIARNVIASLCQPVSLVGHDVYCGGSIGIAMYPLDGEDVGTLVKNADLAMYQAKAQGGSCYQFFSQELNRKALERLMLETSMRRALEKDEFFLHYQPLLSIGTGEIIGMEALLRWHSPDLGLLGPARFIPLAEETGLIVPIGEWVLRTACAQNKAWQAAGFPPLRVAVNVSARQFRQRDFVEMVGEILAATRLDSQYLELELTESVVMEDPDKARMVLSELKRMGVCLSIDDFGTGYSSLSYLRHFPIDKLKIDRTFVKDLVADPDSAAIAEAIIAMAHSLNIQVVAEGVEHREQLEFLRERRCDAMQGFYFSPPVAAGEFAGLLARRAKLTDCPPVS